MSNRSGFCNKRSGTRISPGSIRANTAEIAAVATGCPVRFVLNPTTYAAWQQSATGGRCDPASLTWNVPLTLGDGSSLAGTAPSGVSAAPATTIVFRPAGNTDLGSNLTITVGSYSFVLHAGSGYVDVP